MNEQPILARTSTPDHGPSFWADLDASLVAPTGSTARTSDGPGQDCTETAVRGGRPDRTEVLDIGDARRAPRRMWPLVTAAALLAVVGLALLFTRGGSVPDATQVVSGTAEDESGSALDAPSGGQDTDDATDDQSIAEDTTDNAADDTTDGDSGGGAGPDAQHSGDAAAAPTGDHPGGSSDGTLGASGVPPPAGLPRSPMIDGTLLLTWPSHAVRWYALDDPDEPCRSTISFVNASGRFFPFVEPQPTFAGTIVDLSLSTHQTHMAVVVACAGRLELHIGQVDPDQPGAVLDLDLAWVGPGTPGAVELNWDQAHLTLNAFTADGAAFHVVADAVQNAVSGSGLVLSVGDGAPDNFDSWIVGTVGSGASTWWNGNDLSASDLVCDGTTKRSRSLWHRSDSGKWQPAFAEPVDAGAIVAFAHDATYSQVAFADACPDINSGRFFIGTLRADGQISSVRRIDLGLFATGHVSTLRWVDGQTLFIETDNSNTGGAPLRFNWIFDDGRDGGILQQIG